MFIWAAVIAFCRITHTGLILDSRQDLSNIYHDIDPRQVMSDIRLHC